MYALGLVLYELFAGRPLFQVRTFEERVSAGNVVARSSISDVDPVVDRIISQCLENDSADRPPSALAVAAVLPGGDPLAAALAEGRIPSPDMIAAAGQKGSLRPALAWAFLVLVMGGTVAVAWRVEEVTLLRPDSVPKPPEVLAERARNILAAIGYDEPPVDSEFWFAAPAPNSSAIRFVYRQSPNFLIPQNLLHVVTDTDPPGDAPGMASVVLDPGGRLLHLSVLPNERSRSSSPARSPDWGHLFGEAGLDLETFARVETRGASLLPYNSPIAWEERHNVSADRRRVIGAVLDGTPAYFDVAKVDEPPPSPTKLLSWGFPPVVEKLFIYMLITVFIGAGILARRNLRLGYGDRQGSRRLGVTVALGTVVQLVLGGHQVPVASEQLPFLFVSTGSALLWAGFSWLIYMSVEPYVRRWWPTTLVGWTRLISGRGRDPLVGREVLVGLA